MYKDRLEVFSDAVFAVAITLLALNLMVPGPGHGPLTDQLTHQWQAFVAYLASFFTIGIVWINHHSLLSGVAFVTRPLVFSNLVLLAFVVLVPVSTRLLASYLPVGGSSSHLAAAVYGMVLEGMSVGFVLIVEWTLREGRTQPSFPPDRRWAARRQYYPAVVAFLLVIGSAFIHPLLALTLSAVVTMYYTFEQTPLRAKGVARLDVGRLPGMGRPGSGYSATPCWPSRSRCSRSTSRSLGQVTGRSPISSPTSGRLSSPT